MYLSNPMVSVIVPVYNAESTLRRCADSILEQSYPDLELILVDDGSKDASPLICDSYMQKDARVRVIHKPNSGASATRNLGIAEARGHYLQFVDSDDAHLKSSLRNFICAENRTKLWHNEKISGKSKLTKENGICLQECNT